jgi:cytochrome P450
MMADDLPELINHRSSDANLSPPQPPPAGLSPRPARSSALRQGVLNNSMSPRLRRRRIAINREPVADRASASTGEAWRSTIPGSIPSATGLHTLSTHPQQIVKLPVMEIDMISGAAPERLSFQPRTDGKPQGYFDHSADCLHPVSLPASNKGVLVVRDAKMVRLIMSDPRFSLARLDPSEDTVTGTGYQSPNGMLRQDPPRIRRIRRGIISFFSEQNIAPWRKEIEDMADDLISSLTNGSQPVDLNNGYFEPLIVRSVALCAGITIDESDALYQFSNRVLVRVETADDRDRISNAWRELYDYSNALIVRKLDDADDRLLSKIFAAFKKTLSSDEEIIAASGTMLAGFYTPFGILSVSAVELLQHPDVMKACQMEPKLWDRTVEELMRYKAHFNFFLPRVTIEDVTLGGVKIRSGQVLLPSLHAAVTDPESCPDPSVFNTHRDQWRHNIVFGTGPHFCPGAALSLQWLHVGLKKLFTTLPGLRLAKPYTDLDWQPGSISMPREVLVTWDKGHRPMR